MVTGSVKVPVVDTKADPACTNCGRVQSEHHLVNYADGPHVGVSVLICPNRVFVPMGQQRGTK